MTGEAEPIVAERVQPAPSKDGGGDALAMRGVSGRRARRGRWGRIAIAAVLALLVLVAAASVYRYHRRAGLILPGVRVEGMHVGDMTPARADLAVKALASSIIDRPVVITAFGFEWIRTPRELGATADARRAVEEAVGVAATLSFPSRFLHRILNSPVDRTIPLVIAYDAAKMRQFADLVAARVGLSAERTARLVSTAVREGASSVQLP